LCEFCGAVSVGREVAGHEVAALVHSHVQFPYALEVVTVCIALVDVADQALRSVDVLRQEVEFPNFFVAQWSGDVVWINHVVLGLVGFNF